MAWGGKERLLLVIGGSNVNFLLFPALPGKLLLGCAICIFIRLSDVEHRATGRHSD